MNRTISVAALAGAGILPAVAGPVLAVAEAAQVGHVPTARAASAGTLYTGSTSSMKWGPVTVRIRVQGKRIVNVGAVLPTERARSASINSRAAPILKSEVLKAQSARIHAVSGATMTSGAYIKSLSNAIAKAHL
jgi:uncharacterized protein with FMN-binding domain